MSLKVDPECDLRGLPGEVIFGAPPVKILVPLKKINNYNRFRIPRRPIMDKIGLDVGTKNVVVSWREEGGKIRTMHEVNGYITVRKEDKFTENLLKKQGVPFFDYGNELIILGTKAENLAYSFNKTLKRPMAEGGLSRDDENSQDIMAIIAKLIIHSAIGKEVQPNTILYYCTTAKPLNDDKLNVDFHKRVVKIMIEKFIGPDKIQSYHINEARALTIDTSGPAIGISWGAGTVTVHAGYAGIPIFEFSLIGAGDKIDLDVAKRFGYDPRRVDGNFKETPTSVSKIKHDTDLREDYLKDKLKQAIKLTYELLIEDVVTNIFKGFRENRDKIRFSEKVPILNGGGTAMAIGFMDLLREEFDKHNDESIIPIGEIELVQDPLYAVSKGCLLAAEMHART